MCTKDRQNTGTSQSTHEPVSNCHVYALDSTAGRRLHNIPACRIVLCAVSNLPPPHVRVNRCGSAPKYVSFPHTLNSPSFDSHPPPLRILPSTQLQGFCLGHRLSNKIVTSPAPLLVLGTSFAYLPFLSQTAARPRSLDNLPTEVPRPPSLIGKAPACLVVDPQQYRIVNDTISVQHTRIF